MKKLLLIKANEEEVELEKQLVENDLEFETLVWDKGNNKLHVRVFPSVSVMDDGEQVATFEEYSGDINDALQDSELISSKKKKKKVWLNAKTSAEKFELIAKELGFKGDE